MPVLVPLFVLSFRRADELALAMEARCYLPGIAAHASAPAAGARRRDALLLVLAAAVVVAGGLLVIGCRTGASPASEEPAIWRLDLAYDGTAFDGWARQPGRRTVEGELEDGAGDGAARARCG